MGSLARRFAGDDAFARSVRTARLRSRLSQRQLAAAAGLPVGLLAKIEQGVRRASVGEAAILAAALGVPLAEMVAGPSDPVVPAPAGRPAGRGVVAAESHQSVLAGRG